MNFFSNNFFIECLFYTFKCIFIFIFIDFSGDQTPTPTRLIRNCEEFGLFDDLKHVNPFEETFRKAIDSKSAEPNLLLTTQKSLEIIKSNDEDTLHTPNIFPSDNGNNVKHKTANKPANELCPKNESLLTTVADSNVFTTPSPNSFSNDVKEDIKCVKQLDNDKGNLPKKTRNFENLEIRKSNEFRKIYPKPVVTSVFCGVSSPIKEKIRQSLLKLQAPNSEENVKLAVQHFHVPSSKQSYSSGRIITEEIKRQELKKNHFNKDDANERNREAAKRYRNKQKILHDSLLQRNAQLEAENGLLKKQLQVFKKTHEKCSVTLKYNTLKYK